MIKLNEMSYHDIIKFTKRLFKQELPKPSEYSAISDKGNIVPVQIEAYFLALNKYIEKDAIVLDVGFGLGFGLIISSIHASKVYGIDVDNKAIIHGSEFLKGKLPTLGDIQLFDGYHLPYDSSSIDIIVCVDVIEHVEDYHLLIKEMMRVVKKGVFLSTPNRRPEYTNPDGSPRNYWHLREWSYEEFNKIISVHGMPEWNCINGPWEGPFSLSQHVQNDTMALSPFIWKKR